METITRPVVGDAEYTLTVARFMISQPENWRKGEFECEGKAFCALGAIRYLWFQQPVREEYYGDSVAVRILKRIVGAALTSDLVLWNDAPERTHREVLAAFDAAIAEAQRLGI
jgi:hypothetical protein